MRIPLPPPTPDNLIPPVKQHTFFALAAQFPFQAQSAGYNAANAWWLAEASLLAYYAAGEVEQHLQAAGWKLETFLTNGSTQAFVAGSADAAMAAFRGTEVRDLPQLLADWLVDLDVTQIQVPGGGRVHEGFWRAVDGIFGELEAALRAASDQGRKPVWFTGHSLGGALATVAARRHGNARALYTFGGPRVGDPAYCGSYSLSAFRVVNNVDVVPHVPLVGLLPPHYAHPGTLQQLDADGKLSGQPADCLSVPQIAAALAGHWLIDHAPLYYAIHLANAL